jgi:hypothetical protein
MKATCCVQGHLIDEMLACDCASPSDCEHQPICAAMKALEAAGVKEKGMSKKKGGTTKK